MVGEQGWKLTAARTLIDFENAILDLFENNSRGCQDCIMGSVNRYLRR
jgi:hypothetical protein